MSRAKNKQNPFLESFEAMLEAKYKLRLDIAEEINLITHLISCNEDFKVGSGRAEKAINGFLETKMDITDTILGDDDVDLVYTKHTLTKRLKSVLGPDNWEKYKFLFPLLKEFWDA